MWVKQQERVFMKEWEKDRERELAMYMMFLKWLNDRRNERI